MKVEPVRLYSLIKSICGSTSIISAHDLNPAREHMIYGFFETYLQLTDEEEEKLMKEVENLPREEAELLKNLPISYEEKGIEKGRQIERKEVALEMLKKGLRKDLIAELTHLNIEEIEKLKEKF